MLREALGQLAGLKRRKLALEMLGAAVQAGLNQRLGETSPKQDEASKKRKLDFEGGAEKSEDTAKEPAMKKTKIEA